MTSVIIKNSDPILVTGAYGFLGTHLMNALRNQNFQNIIPIAHANVELTNPQHAYDICDIYKPSAILHLAGVVGGIGANKDRPGDFFYENIQMGINVINAARLKGVRRVIMIGTVCSYPKHTPTPFAEEHLWYGYPEETNASYGIAKRSLMHMCQAYNEQYGMNNVCLIPTNLYGPQDNFNPQTGHVIPALIQKFYHATTHNEDTVTLWGSGNVSREFLYVKDCASAIIKALRFCNDPGPINLGTGKEITIKRLAQVIADLMNYTGQIVWDTSQPDGQPRRCLKTDKALDLFNWKATTHFVTGLVETTLWYEEAITNGSINDYI